VEGAVIGLFLHVIDVKPLSGYALWLMFSDGAVREVDLKAELYGEVFEPLREPALFSRVFVNPETGTIEWPNGADFAPEFLASIGKDIGSTGQGW